MISFAITLIRLSYSFSKHISMSSLKLNRDLVFHFHQPNTIIVFRLFYKQTTHFEVQRVRTRDGCFIHWNSFEKVATLNFMIFNEWVNKQMGKK